MSTAAVTTTPASTWLQERLNEGSFISPSHSEYSGPFAGLLEPLVQGLLPFVANPHAAALVGLTTGLTPTWVNGLRQTMSGSRTQVLALSNSLIPRHQLLRHDDPTIQACTTFAYDSEPQDLGFRGLAVLCDNSFSRSPEPNVRLALVLKNRRVGSGGLQCGNFTAVVIRPDGHYDCFSAEPYAPNTFGMHSLGANSADAPIIEARVTNGDLDFPGAEAFLVKTLPLLPSYFNYLESRLY